MTDHQRHTITAHMPNLLAVPTHNVPETTTRTPITAATWAATVIATRAALRAVPSHMACHIARVANRIVEAITRQVAGFPTVLTSLVVCTVSSDVALFVAVVAESHVARWHLRSGAFPRTVAGFPTRVADPLVRAVSGHVPGLSTVPT